MKTCRGCGDRKPLGEFYAHPTSADRHDQQCKLCRKAISAGRHARLKDTPGYKAQRAREARRRKLRDVYAVTLEDYEAHLAEQHGKCAICGTSDPGRGSEFFPVDHDHVTGEVRGLLCHDCNLGLGRFGDDADRLVAAAMYLLVRQNVLARL